MPTSAYASALALRLLLQNDATGRPSEWGLALATAPIDQTTFPEAADAAYARLPTDFPTPSTEDFITPSTALTTWGRYNLFSFATPTTVYGNAVMDAAHAGGNVLQYNNFPTPMLCGNGVGERFVLADMVCEITPFENVDGVSMYGRNLILNFYYRGEGQAVPAVYLALSTDLPDTDNNIAYELGDSGYQRQTAVFTPDTKGTFRNQDPLTFGPFSNDQTVVGFALMDANSDGNMLFGCSNNNGVQVIPAGSTFTLQANDVGVFLA